MLSAFLLLAAGDFTRPAEYHTLERLLAPAERVFVGTVASLDARTLHATVREELRGHGGVAVELPRKPADRHDASLPGFVGKADYLFMLGPKEPGGWIALRLGDARPEELRPDLTVVAPKPDANGRLGDLRFTDPKVVYDDSLALPILGMDLALLRTPASALARARAFLKGSGPTDKESPIMLTLQFPPEIGPTDRDSFTWLDLPVVPALEPIARRMILQPRTMIPLRFPHRETIPATNPPGGHEQGLDEFRGMGISLLVDFKTPRNVALLKELLKDPTIADGTDSMTKKPIRMYTVRVMAAEILKEWKVDFGTPTITLPPKPE